MRQGSRSSPLAAAVRARDHGGGIARHREIPHRHVRQVLTQPRPAGGLAAVGDERADLAPDDQLTAADDELVDGASGRFPVTFVQVAPPLWVSNTWPSPAVGIHLRLNEPNVMYTCAGSAGSAAIDVMYRFGRPFRFSSCHEPP